ncbi:hypothetical protein CVT26_003945, partial [Gymnopilus dilepis]
MHTEQTSDKETPERSPKAPVVATEHGPSTPTASTDSNDSGTATTTAPADANQPPSTTPRKSYFDVLELWQNTCLLEDRITFNKAVELLAVEGKERVLEAKCGTGYKASTWTMFNKKTNQDAIFVHAALWLSGSDLYTGNFVPKGEAAP